MSAFAMDIDAVAPGNETDTLTYDGCPPDGAVEQWRMNGSPHAPTFPADFAARMRGWLMAHGRT